MSQPASGPAADPLNGLLDLPGVPEALNQARAAIDGLLWDREVARHAAQVRAESALRGAWCNAWFEGAECGLAQLRDGSALDGSPVGTLLTGVVGLHWELPGLVGIVGSAPAQALARMHAVVARGIVAEDRLGRPGVWPPDDPLRLPEAPGPDEAAARLAGLGQVLVGSAAPGVLVAAIALGEVAAVRPFAWGSGLVARALPRLVLAQRGVDPEMLGAPEVGLRALGRPAHVRALRGYMSGGPDGVAGWIRHVCEGISRGAQAAPGWIVPPTG